MRPKRLAVIRDWLPDYPGQTGDQKAQDLTGQPGEPAPNLGKRKQGGLGPPPDFDTARKLERPLPQDDASPAKSAAMGPQRSHLNQSGTISVGRLHAKGK